MHVQNSAVCEEAFWAKQIEKYFGDRAVLYPVLHTTIYVCVVCVWLVLGCMKKTQTREFSK